MTVTRGANLLLKGVVVGDTIQVFYFNGLPDHIFKRIKEELGDCLVFASKNVSIGMTKAAPRQQVELLCNISYTEKHCNIYDLTLSVYKLRAPKCINGLKPAYFSLRRIADECFKQN